MLRPKLLESSLVMIHFKIYLLVEVAFICVFATADIYRHSTDEKAIGFQIS